MDNPDCLCCTLYAEISGVEVISEQHIVIVITIIT